MNGKEKDSGVGGEGGRNENEHELTRLPTFITGLSQRVIYFLEGVHGVI